MKRCLTLTLLTLNACGPDAFFSFPPDSAPDSDPAGDATPDAAGDAKLDADADADADAIKSDAACELSGSMECTNVVAAYCMHYASCCSQFPGNGKCSVGWSSAGSCKQDLSQTGYDCNGSKYNRPVCAPGTSCSSSVNAAACGIVFQSTGPSDAQFATCPAFWSQF